MKPITTFILLLVISRSLFAQNPVVTLSASTFYRGDAPGSYTISCPANTSAAISVMTKIADVPLLDPASTQYAIGAVFPWPSVSNNPLPTLTGTLPQSYTTTVMSGTVTYNAGALTCNAYCNTGSFINTTSKSFTLALGGMTRDEEAIYKTQKTYALRANAVTLPRLTTADQTTLPPQQAGNVVYNTDQQKMAVHNGTNWQYINTNAPEASQFKNQKLFEYSSSSYQQKWTVPAGVTRIMAEVWGAGAGGPIYSYSGSELKAYGGGAGTYSRGFMTVTPGTALTLTIGQGGDGAVRSSNSASTNGGLSLVADGQNSQSIGSSGGDQFGGYGYGVIRSGDDNSAGFIGYGAAGGAGTISYGQKSTSEYILIIKCGDGGTAYGVQPGSGGFGTQITSTNSSVLLYTSGESLQSHNGMPPGGGGGCGYNKGGYGANGLIILYW